MKANKQHGAILKIYFDVLNDSNLNRIGVYTKVPRLPLGL